MTLFDRWANRPQPTPLPDSDPLDEIDPPPVPPRRPRVPQLPPEDLLRCDQCGHHATDMTAAVAHARMHARAWADEARLAEKARHELARDYRTVVDDVTRRLRDLGEAGR